MNSLSGHVKKYKKYQIQIFDITTQKMIIKQVYPWLKVKSLKNDLSKELGIPNMKLTFMNNEFENEKLLDDYLTFNTKESIFFTQHTFCKSSPTILSAKHTNASCAHSHPSLPKPLSRSKRLFRKSTQASIKTSIQAFVPREQAEPICCIIHNTLQFLYSSQLMRRLSLPIIQEGLLVSLVIFH